MQITAIAAALADVQHRLHSARGLIAMRNSIRRTPDGFSRELKRDVLMHLQRDLADEWRLQQFLPDAAANDTQHTPGAA